MTIEKYNEIIGRIRDYIAEDKLAGAGADIVELNNDYTEVLATVEALKRTNQNLVDEINELRTANQDYVTSIIQKNQMNSALETKVDDEVVAEVEDILEELFEE